MSEKKPDIKKKSKKQRPRRPDIKKPEIQKKALSIQEQMDADLKYLEENEHNDVKVKAE